MYTNVATSTVDCHVCNAGSSRRTNTQHVSVSPGTSARGQSGTFVVCKVGFDLC